MKNEKIKNFANQLFASIKDKNFETYSQHLINKKNEKKFSKNIGIKSKHKKRIKLAEKEFKTFFKEIENKKINLSEFAIDDINVIQKQDETVVYYVAYITGETSLHSIEIIFPNLLIFEDSLIQTYGGIDINVLSSKALDQFKTKEENDDYYLGLKRYKAAEAYHAQYIDEDSYELEEENSYVSLSFGKKLKKEDLQKVEIKLGVSIPTELKEVYLKYGNGNYKEGFELFDVDSIQSLSSFFQERIINQGACYNLFKEDGFEEPLSPKEITEIQRLNENYFVFGVAWNDYQFMDILIFNKSHHFYGLFYSGELEQYIFSEYLEKFEQTQKSYPAFNPFFNKYIDVLISDRLLGNLNGHDEKVKLFYNN